MTARHLQPTLSLDMEHDGLDPQTCVPWSITYAYGKGKPVVIANPNGLRLKDLPASLVRDLKNPDILKIAHNIKNDGAILLAQFGILVQNWWCTMEGERNVTGVAIPVELFKKKTLTASEERFMSAYSIALERVLPRYGLGTLDKEIREAFIDRPRGIPFTKKELGYMVKDVGPLYPLYLAQLYLLMRDGQLEVALLEHRYAYKKIIARVRGVGFDQEVWRKVAIDNTREFKKRGALLPREVENWNSPKQVKDYFKYNHNIVIPTYKSKTPDVDDIDSLYLKTRNRTLGQFILYRELHKSVTSYGLNWLNEAEEGKNQTYIGADGRLHPSVSQQKETGRISMSNPNLLQLPGFGRKDYEHELVMRILYKEIKQERARPQHRRAFIPANGNVFIFGDFKGQEIGVMAAASKEKLWLDAMLRGEDVHSLMATIMYREDWDAGWLKTCKFPAKCSCPLHSEPRERAKTNNFRRAYGGGPSSYAKAVGVDMRTAVRDDTKHKRALPRLIRYLEKSAREAAATGISYSASPYRRRRVLKNEEDWRIRNQGMNNPIQAAGADMVKLAVISIPDEYYQPLDIYDEIWLEVPYRDGPKAAEMLKSIMEKSADYITGVPGLIKVDPKIQWNAAKDDESVIVQYGKLKRK